MNTAALVGAALGAKALAFLQTPEAGILAGKSVVGGLLGGTIGVEAAKRAIGITAPTGDRLVLPLCAAIAIGRIGCFLMGLSDGTHGVATSLPWGWNYGDGIRRHPTQIYEILFLCALAAALVRFARTARPGATFRAFLGSYLLFRVGVDAIKPAPRILYLSLSPIQWACLAGLPYAARGIRTA